MLINAWVATVPCCSVVSVRKRLQASGIERGRSSFQEYMKAEHWPAKQMICFEILVFLCQFYFVVLPQVKNQHLTAPNKWRRVEWSTSTLQCLGEEKRPHSGCCSCKTHISRSFHAIFSLSSFPFCRRASRIFHPSFFSGEGDFSVSARLCLGAPCRVHDADCL